jgi:hypothetical protein
MIPAASISDADNEQSMLTFYSFSQLSCAFVVPLLLSHSILGNVLWWVDIATNILQEKCDLIYLSQVGSVMR